jgi:hypothetical protein
MIKPDKFNKFKNIIDFLNNSSIEKIVLELKNILNEYSSNDQIIGKGYFGIAKISKVCETMDITLDKSLKISIPVIVKETREDKFVELNMKNIDNILYIHSEGSILCEIILLIYALDLWYKKISPHLPILINYGKTNNDKINRLITEKQGLDKNIYFEVNRLYGLERGDFPWVNKKPIGKVIYDSSIATLSDLIKYIKLKKEGKYIILPNGNKCNIIKLLDYLCISYIHTHQLLKDNNIGLWDMHASNTFIHWLNGESYMGNQNISKIKNIVYKINNKYIKIKTFGLILKMGDIGDACMKIKNDVYLYGVCVNFDQNYKLIKEVLKPNFPSIIEILCEIRDNIPFNIYKKTVAFNILSNKPYDEDYIGLHHMYHINNKYLTGSELLDKYSKYYIDKPKTSKKTLII